MSTKNISKYKLKLTLLTCMQNFFLGASIPPSRQFQFLCSCVALTSLAGELHLQDPRPSQHAKTVDIVSYSRQNIFTNGSLFIFHF